MSGGRPSPRVQALVRQRATAEWDTDPVCERCGRNLNGWDGYSYHHRRLKGQGGDSRPDTNEAANILLLCGSGTTGCHGWTHHDTTGQARSQGFVVGRWASPVEAPVLHALHGPVRLDDAGGWAAAGNAEPPALGGGLAW